MTTAVLPQQVAPYAGRIVDCDSHELMPTQLWVEVFGEVGMLGLDVSQQAVDFLVGVVQIVAHVPFQSNVIEPTLRRILRRRGYDPLWSLDKTTR